LSASEGNTATQRQWVFGYGSLVDAAHLANDLASYGLGLGDYSYCELMGFKRTWSVAMDNALNEPGYKYYIDPQTRVRPDVFVAFVNLEPQDGDASRGVCGILFEVGPEALSVLDRRERNYDRCDVTPSISAVVDGTVWTYVGHAQARARYEAGLARNRLVISAAYRDLIETAYTKARLPYSAELPANVRELPLARVDT
jgi:cation transport regulator ChaC